MIIDGLSDADAAWVHENETLDIWRMLERRSTHLGNLVIDTESRVAWCDLQVKPWGWPIRYESWDTKPAYEAGSPQWERRHQTHGNQVLLAPAEGEKPRSSGSKRFVVQSILPTLLARHLDGKRLTTLCDFWNIKHINGRPNSAPKLPTDTEYITRVTLQTKLLCLLDRNAESGSMKCPVGRALDRLSRLSIPLVFTHETIQSPSKPTNKTLVKKLVKLTTHKRGRTSH